MTTPGAEALADLGQISPIVTLTGFLLFAIVIDLVLPKTRRGDAVAMVAATGFVYSLATRRLSMELREQRACLIRLRDRRQVRALLRDPVRAPRHPHRRGLAPYLKRRGMLEGEFHILIVAAVIGMMVVASATSLVTVFLGLELLSIALYIACGFARGETRSQEAAAKYLLIGGFASAFVLYGMALIYGGAGTTVIPEIATRLEASASGNPLILLGIVLMGVGFAFKVSAAPFHMWTPDVYQGAPIPSPHSCLSARRQRRSR